uniref:Uncharacterized protein n=1 Tax=Oryza glaberrima TaxID=4538 RepID=I1QBK7_ORYGL
MPSSSPPPHQPRCRGCSRFAVPLARRPLSKAITGIDDGVSVRRSSGGSARKRRNGVGIHAAGIDDGDVGRGTLLLCLRAEGSGQPARLATIDNRVLQKAAHVTPTPPFPTSSASTARIAERSRERGEREREIHGFHRRSQGPPARHPPQAAPRRRTVRRHREARHHSHRLREVRPAPA